MFISVNIDYFFFSFLEGTVTKKKGKESTFFFFTYVGEH